MKRARDEQGFALVAALVLMAVILGLGVALLTFTDNQQSASLREQASESSFNVSEGALNAQIGQLSRAWPGKLEEKYLEACTEGTTTGTNGCPTAASLSVGYPNISPVACPTGSVKDAWGSPLTNEWTTYVRDNAELKTTFNSAVERTQPTWDANGDGKMWVRSVGVVQCRTVSAISLISRQLVSLSFPTNVASGSWFAVTNSGKHKGEPVVDTNGRPDGQSGQISMRCEPGHTPCEEWDVKKEQIEPDTTHGTPLPTPLLSDAELLALREEALVAGTLRTPTVKGCPGSLSELSGKPAYVEGCGDLHMTGGTGNSSTAPGFLVLADGTLEINGNAEFFGVIYAHNPSNYAGAVVALGGNATVVGAIDIDGPGGIEFGSNGINLIYAPQALKEVKTFAGATSTRNTFRVLPVTQ